MQGPLGEFFIPDEPPETHGHVLLLSQHVFDGEYEHAELPSDGIKHIIDVGCGWGAFAVWAHAKWPAADIVGYDPHGAALQYFRRNAPFATGILRAITVDPAPFYGVSWEWGSGHTRGRSEGFRVPARHPRDLSQCDILKIDAEGVETEILEHYPILGDVKVVLVEWHSQALKAACDSLMKSRTQLRCVAEQNDRDYGVSIWVI